MKSFYVCDIETTGTNPLNVEMVEFYMAHYQGRTMKKEIHLFIRPRYWDKAADASVEFHKITKEKAREGTPWRMAMSQIWDFLPDEPAHFICHANRRMFGRSGCYDWLVMSSHFLDIGFEFYQHFVKVFPPKFIISTHSLAKELLGIDSNKLEFVAPAAGVPFDKTKYHGAKYDASITWKVFQKLKQKVNLDAFCEEDYYQFEKGIIMEKNSSDKVKEKSMTDGFDLFNTHTIQGDENEIN